nr:flavonol 4'-sulfotransferase [Tanacetum cinerariifolium]
MEDAPFDEAFQEFCQGISAYGPYWDHLLGYWKASLERPGTILLLKYEDMKGDTSSSVKRLAEFIGYPFSVEEEKAGVKGHIIKSCPVKTKDDAELAENHSKESAKGNKEEIKPTQPKVSIKYLEFIYFKARGILKGTDQGTWDDLWYLSSTTDKHLCNNLNFFCKIKENFLVEKLEDQMKFLFTYGLNEVVIKNDNQGYLIPRVHYAPEVTLNRLVTQTRL